MRFRALLAWSWTVLILFLCWLPRTYMPVPETGDRPFFVPNFDKVVHLGIFAVFGFLWMIVRTSNARARWVFLGGVALTILSELGQELPVVGRDATVMDGVADIVGVGVGILADRLLRRFYPKPAA